MISRYPELVAVSGLGLVTSLGCGVSQTFASLCRGENGIREIPAWKNADFPVQVAGMPSPDELRRFTELAPEAATYRSRKALYAAVALQEALAMIGSEVLAEGRGGFFLGVETGRIDIGKLFHMFTLAGTPKGLDPVAFGEKSFRFLTAHEALSKQPFFLPNLLSRLSGLPGETRAVSNACSSANQAIGEAFRKVALGELDWAITGGADDMVDEYMAMGFTLLGALATGVPAELASCPFDLHRKGFVLGEGAGLLVLEPLSRVLKRGGRPLALLSAYGSGASASRITETTWEGIFQTMKAALAEAGLSTDDVDYINAHGTGTPMNDPAETRAIRELLKERARQIPVNSTKSMIGHLIAAAAAVEAVVCVQSIVEGKVHPTRNLRKADPACDLDYVVEGARTLPIRHALSNSLGFAGINSTLVFSRCP